MVLGATVVVRYCAGFGEERRLKAAASHPERQSCDVRALRGRGGDLRVRRPHDLDGLPVRFPRQADGRGG